MSRFPAAFPLPAFASWSSFPAEELGLPHGRLTGHTAGPRRGFHVPHARATTGVGALYTPGTTVLTRAGHDHQPASAAPPRLSPCTPPRPPSMRGSALRGINEGSSNSPVRSSPRSTPPDGTGSAFSFPPSFARRPCEQRTSGRGQATEHGPETRSTTSAEPPTSRIYSMRATSRRTRECRSRFGYRARHRGSGLMHRRTWAFARRLGAAVCRPIRISGCRRQR